MHLVTMHHFCKSYVNDVGFWELLFLFKKSRMYYYLLSCKYVVCTLRYLIVQRVEINSFVGIF